MDKIGKINSKWQKAIFLAILLFSVIAQESIFGRWKISSVYLDLPLTILILWIFLGVKFRDIFIVALAAGLILDVLSGLSFGFISFTLLLTLWLTDVFLTFLSRKNVFHFVLLVFLSTLVFNAIIFGLSELLYLTNILSANRLSIKIPDFLVGVGLGTLANLLAGIILYTPFKKWIIS